MPEAFPHPATMCPSVLLPPLYTDVPKALPLAPRTPDPSTAGTEPNPSSNSSSNGVVTGSSLPAVPPADAAAVEHTNTVTDVPLALPTNSGRNSDSSSSSNSNDVATTSAATLLASASPQVTAALAAAVYDMIHGAPANINTVGEDSSESDALAAELELSAQQEELSASLASITQKQAGMNANLSRTAGVQLSQLPALVRELHKANSKADTAQADTTAAVQRAASLSEQLEQSQGQIAMLEGALAAAGEKQAATEAKVTAATAQVQSAPQDLVEQTGSLAQQVQECGDRELKLQGRLQMAHNLQAVTEGAAFAAQQKAAARVVDVERQAAAKVSAIEQRCAAKVSGLKWWSAAKVFDLQQQLGEEQDRTQELQQQQMAEQFRTQQLQQQLFEEQQRSQQLQQELGTAMRQILKLAGENAALQETSLQQAAALSGKEVEAAGLRARVAQSDSERFILQVGGAVFLLGGRVGGWGGTLVGRGA